MGEAATIADLQHKVAQLTKEVDRQRNDKTKDVLKNQGNVNLSDERQYRLEAVSSVLDKLRNEFEAIKLSSESNPQSHNDADKTEKDVSDSDTSTDISSLESTFSSSIGSSSIATDSDTETETQSNQDPNEVETFVITLKGKSKLPPFTQLLPNVFSRALQAESLTKGTSTETIQQSPYETQTKFTVVGIDKETSSDLHSSATKVVPTQTTTNRSSNSSLENETVAKFIELLKGQAQLQPFIQHLSVIINAMQILPTAKIQLECIRLIQTFLPPNLSELTAELKANLVESMLTGLQSNFEEDLIVECANTLAKLEIFADPIDNYTKTVEILLKIISNPEMTTKTKRSTMWLLSEILSKSDENRQNRIGQMGCVEQICEVIRQPLNNPTNEWSCLANLCFSSLENKKKFLSAGGIDLFHYCYEYESNLSCDSAVRPQLVSKRNFDVFWKILIEFNDNAAISYRCVRVFDNFLSDSTTIWPLDSPTVEEAKNLLIEMIKNWKLDANINIDIDTLEPYLDELKLHKSPLTNLLVIWTIANLTAVDAPKYCRMLSDEGGVEILTTEVIRHSNSSAEAKRLALTAVDNTIIQLVRKRNPLDEDPDEIDQLITELTEEMKILPFSQLLPKILSQSLIGQASTKHQLECIRLIQLFLLQNLSELTVELNENLVETMMTCLQSNLNDGPIYVLSWIYLSNFCCDSLENQKKILSAGGIDLFHLCYEKFGDEVEMIDEIMNMMCTLSSLPSIMPQLVSKKNFDVFWRIFLKFNDNAAISYRCVHIFDNFLSDSTTIWPLDSPTVEDAKNLLIETINKWKLEAQTNYRCSSFKSALNDLKLHQSPLGDLIWIWTIANVTTVEAPKYCQMLRDEGGVEILTTEVIQNSNSSQEAKKLALVALDNVKRWESTVTHH